MRTHPFQVDLSGGICRMNVINWEYLNDPPKSAITESPVSLAVGVFDGVHRGHQRLLRRAVSDAERMEQGVAAVLTFDPNPATVVRPDLWYSASWRSNSIRWG